MMYFSIECLSTSGISFHHIYMYFLNLLLEIVFGDAFFSLSFNFREVANLFSFVPLYFSMYMYIVVQNLTTWLVGTLERGIGLYY